MADQSRYNIDSNHNNEGWVLRYGWLAADSWQKAITSWIEWNKGPDASYQVISEEPAEDGLSGVLNIAAEWLNVSYRVKATQTHRDPVIWWETEPFRSMRWSESR